MSNTAAYAIAAVVLFATGHWIGGIVCFGLAVASGGE